ncbi:alpha-2-macroglobulin [Sediminibacter sp. Hel_I_10]|uniref:alpha-2-macroglobulin family protein n=1 Tax=Sediminibacter sp. Hel_I_10 TaxID=1392490 RepID=UPI00056B92B9|nr:MG2 domain-containing protein [Sediminibacter sp. Hel_I_10]
MSQSKTLLILLISLLCSQLHHAQSSGYDALWKQVLKKETDGLPKSALDIVKQISEKAETENNSAQYIKALLFKSKYALTLEEEAQLEIVKNFKSEIEKAKAPEKHILENMLATMYWQYFQQHRYQFYNRSKTEEKVNAEDFRTWDLQTLFDDIDLYYQKSLKNPKKLQQTPIAEFAVIINEQKGSKIYRPSLYDILAQNALTFYTTSENSITKPAYQFEIDDPSYLSPASEFATITLQSKDSTSLELNALKIYQNLIAFHLKDVSLEALVAVDVERLRYASQNSTFDNKEDILLSTLQSSSKERRPNPVAALYDFEIANLYYEQGNRYDIKTHPEARWKLKEAIAICDATLKNYPDSSGAEQCAVLKRIITNPTLHLTSETVIPTNQHARILVRYANIKTLDFTVYEVGITEIDNFNTIYNEAKKLNFLKNKSVSKAWTSTLKTEGDYQTHTTEIIVPPLKNGNYIILAKTDGEGNTFATQTLQTTNFALVDTSSPTEISFQIINRTNGAPQADVSAELKFQNNYNSDYKTVLLESDSNGMITIEKTQQRYMNLSIALKDADETGYFDGFYAYRNFNNTEEVQIKDASFLFTDRSIYRPGQTVYFKGISISSKNETSQVLADENVAVKLYNVNGELLNSLALVTNSFGSVAGEFILPSGGLTGEFRLQLTSNNKNRSFESNHYVSVEEYKRPKFETTFNPVTETFKVNDSVTVKGKALAYAGSSITDAKVVYRVTRTVEYPRWYYSYRPWFNSEPQELKNGEIQTNSNGEFEITFKAQPDASVGKSTLPIFNYKITADVTDLNGETRSATTVVNVGYHALLATISIEEQLDKTKKDHTIAIDTRNLNGEFVAAEGQIKIYKLKAPERVLTARSWEAPDYQVIPLEEYKMKFPHEAYGNEADPEQWEKGALVFEANFDTEKSKELALGNIKKWASGKYLISLESKDKFGQLVKDEARTTLYSDTDKTLADNQLFSMSTNQNVYNAGEQVEITLGSAAKDVVVTVKVEKNGSITNTFIVPLRNSKQTLAIPVTKDDVGGFAIHYSLAAFNSFLSSTLNINVPYPKTDLEIETVTFRDQLQPGTEETWSFKIKGPKGDKVSAEILASMYDASLDQFKSHDWNFSPINTPTYYPKFSLNARQSFGNSAFRIYNRERQYFNYESQQYDQLNWFGFYFGDNSLRQNYLRKQRISKPSTFSSIKKTDIKKGVIKGIVSTSDGLPLPGVNITIKGKTEAVSTDFDGEFSMSGKAGDIILFSYIGYRKLSLTISKDNFYKIVLNEDSSGLDEVVVMGYVKSTKESFTGTATISTSDIKLENDDKIQGLTNNRGKNAYSIKEGKFTKSDSLENPEYYFLMRKASAVPMKTIMNGMTNLYIYDVSKKQSLENVVIRKNLQETAFFFPQLQTDAEGNVSFSFTTPEALTKWKLQLLAHTKSLESKTTSLETVTQKELMIIPNAPRFLRQGDEITISTKISNLTENTLSGQTQLLLTDALTGTTIDAKLNNTNKTQAFSVDANGNTQVSWNLSIPDNVDAVQYKIVAKAGSFSDGEQNAMPVLTNRLLVTETLPMWIKSNETKTFTLDKLAATTPDDPNTTLKNHKLILEVTSNPMWYAVQALPYLMEYPYDCNEQTFSRYYANALASHIANSNPRIQEVFNQWASQGELISNLEKNEALKNILIQETPWLRDAQSETEQKKRIALLFDMNKMTNELASSQRKLKNNQMDNGAWAWFHGGKPNRFITQHIITGFGHLDKLNVASVSSEDQNRMIEKAIIYLDSEFVQEYKDLTKFDKKTDLSKDHLSFTQLHYLYMRSFFPQIKMSKDVQDISTYYQTQIQKYWLSRSLYAKGLMALIMQRNAHPKIAEKILNSLKETSITSDELGMYWKSNNPSWHWYQAPIETQALMIEVFAEVGQAVQTETSNLNDIDQLKIWLLKNKQTNKWETTKATTEAVYALLLQGRDWLVGAEATEMVDVVLGNEPIDPSKLENVKVEPGTGYYKTAWSGSEITPEMATVTLTKNNPGIAWGSLYWQYFEDLDKITSAETPLALRKKLFKKTNTDRGEQLSEITSETDLKVGDLIRVRIELQSDRDMEFIHMKDMRAAGLEPINVVSAYKFQDGLGYYESTKDASTNFFFDFLPKGIYVFEYDLRINNAGNMSNGITTIQSMYAPEFSSHSEGVRVKVD